MALLRMSTWSWIGLHDGVRDRLRQQRARGLGCDRNHVGLAFAPYGQGAAQRTDETPHLALIGVGLHDDRRRVVGGQQHFQCRAHLTRNH
jgi:hypothetical protein